MSENRDLDPAIGVLAARPTRGDNDDRAAFTRHRAEPLAHRFHNSRSAASEQMESSLSNPPTDLERELLLCFVERISRANDRDDPSYLRLTCGLHQENPLKGPLRSC